jgi:DNA-binding transcriptional LysR family regulator
MKDAALRGAGVATLPRFAVKDELASGRLVHVGAGIELPRMEVALLHPFGRNIPARLGAFIQFAVDAWRSGGDLEG